ncbi:MAG: hypothetical protein J6T99_08305 [Oscillospiraceae bacterium]|nr:hypothetical protein [Oscillospiraceae bacterium]
MMGSSKTQLRRRLFYAALLLLYLGFHFFVILHHEAFRDEAQAWTIAKNTTLPELFADLSIEGHPCLWFLIIRPFAKLGMSFRSFSFVSLVFMGVAAGLFLFRAPFGDLLKVIVLGSFAFCYNSPVMPRTYCVITLLIVCLAMLWPRRLEKPVLYGILIGLLFQSHIILAGFAGGLVLELFIHWLKRKPRINRLFWGMAIPAASALFTVYELLPRKDAPVFVDTSAQSILGKMHLSLNQFIAAVNDLEETVWGNLVCELQIGSVTGKAVILLILLLLFLALLLAVTAKKEWHTFWSIALIGFCGLGFSLGLRLFVYRGGYHMTVCYFLILLFLVWISYSSIQAKSVKTVAGILLAFTLLLTCEKWINAVKFDLTEAFSGSRPTADFIDATVEQNGIILVREDHLIPSVYAYVDSDRKDITFRSIDTGEDYKFHVWGAVYPAFDLQALPAYAYKQFPDAETVYYLSSSDAGQPDGLEELYRMDSRNPLEENYWFYRLSNPSLQTGEEIG